MEWGQDLVAVMSRVAVNHPKTAYTGLHKSLHQEWSFVQHVTPDIGMLLQTIEDALRNVLLPSLFKWSKSHIPRREFIGLPINNSWIYLPYPTQTV